MSDRLALAHAIEDAGIPREKAESVATAIARFIEGSAATKADVDRVEAALKADVQAVRADLQATETRLNARIDLVEHRLLTRLGGLAVVLSGLIIAVLHYWQPHP
jgi:hypothetical protein